MENVLSWEILKLRTSVHPNTSLKELKNNPKSRKIYLQYIYSTKIGVQNTYIFLKHIEVKKEKADFTIETGTEGLNSYSTKTKHNTEDDNQKANKYFKELNFIH